MWSFPCFEYLTFEFEPLRAWDGADPTGELGVAGHGLEAVPAPEVRALVRDLERPGSAL